MRRAVIHGLILSFLALALATALGAASFTYTSWRKVMKVGVLTLPGGTNANPYIFFVLDQRSDLKPAGWEFDNPAAPARVNSTVKAAHPGLDLNQAIYKNMSAYWEVPLQATSQANLMQFDLLYMSIGGGIAFEPAEAEKLRKFVDAGGQLWLDGVDRTTSVPWFFIPFPKIQTAGGGSAVVVNRHHPTVSYPFWLTDYDLNYLGPRGAAGYQIDASADGAKWHGWYVPVVLNSASGAPVVAVSEYGSGHVIVTSGNVGSGVGGGVTVDLLQGNVASRMISMANPVCLKFGYNVAGWCGVYSTFHRDARHSGRSPDPTDAPMVKKWSFPQGGRTTPAFMKGVFFVSFEDGYVRAFDANPGKDQDNDGDPNDGLHVSAEDTGGFDMLWEYQVTSGISSPTVATVPTVDSAGNPASSEIVFVTARDGRVVALEAFPRDPQTGRLLPQTFEPPSYLGAGQPMSFPTPGVPSDPPPAPTYCGGWVYVGLKDERGAGRLYARAVAPPEARFPCFVTANPMNPSEPLPTNEWRFPAAGFEAYQPGEIVGSPSVGFVKDETSEALDFVCYFTCKANRASSNPLLAQQEGRIFGLLLAVRNERLRPTTSQEGGKWLFEARSGIPGVLGQGDEAVWIREVTYDVRGFRKDWLTGTMSEVAVDATPSKSTPGRYMVSLPDNDRATAVYLDYLLDPAQFRPITQFAVSSLMVNGRPLQADVRSTPALGSNDMAYFGMIRDAPGGVGGALSDYRGGQLYAFREGGPSRDQVKWQYYINPNVIKDYWQAELGKPMPRIQFQSTPAVADNVVYATGTTDSPGADGCGVLMAFDADPQFCWYTDFKIDLSKPVGIKQIDWQLDPTGTNPAFATSARTGNFDDYAEGKIVMKNFAGTNLTPSADVTITYWSPDGVQHEETHHAFPNRVDPQTGTIPADQPRPAKYDRWNNLLWYYIPRHADPNGPPGSYRPCSGISCSPTVIGDYVYFVCNDGYLIAVEAKPHMTDPTLPKNGQIFDGATPRPPWIKWAIPNHVPWMEKLTDSAGGPTIDSSYQWAVAGAGGYVGVMVPNAFVVYASPATLVADANRVLELGGSNVIWSCDGTIERGVAGGELGTGTGVLTAQRKSFNRPTALKRVSDNEYICADTGNNRVVRFDRGGTTMLEITSFVDPLGKLNPGDPLTLREPTDVYMWVNREADPVLPNRPMAIIQHYLIADKGNYRVLDLGLRMDARTGAPLDPPAYVVLWASKTQDLGKRYAYQTVQLDPDYRNPNQPRQYVLTSISNYAVGGIAAESETPERVGSSIVTLNYRTMTDMSNLGWTYEDGLLGDTLITDTDSGPISGLTYFARYYKANVYYNVICDAAGVHVQTVDRGKQPPYPWWHLWSTENSSPASGVRFDRLKRKIQGWNALSLGVPLRATSAKITDEGHLLVSNAYVGTDCLSCDPDNNVIGDARTAVHGEVVEITMNPAEGEPPVVWYAPQAKAVRETSGGQSYLTRVEYSIGGTSVLSAPGFVDR